jgi:hypothetical protein
MVAAERAVKDRGNNAVAILQAHESKFSCRAPSPSRSSYVERALFQRRERERADHMLDLLSLSLPSSPSSSLHFTLMRREVETYGRAKIALPKEGDRERETEGPFSLLEVRIAYPVTSSPRARHCDCNAIQSARKTPFSKIPTTVQGRLRMHGQWVSETLLFVIRRNGGKGSTVLHQCGVEVSLPRRRIRACTVRSMPHGRHALQLLGCEASSSSRIQLVAHKVIRL